MQIFSRNFPHKIFDKLNVARIDRRQTYEKILFIRLLNKTNSVKNPTNYIFVKLNVFSYTLATSKIFLKNGKRI